MPENLGFINLNKPAGWTSHDCVARVRRLLKIKRVGHGGTLDPAATGVLPIAVGKATRLLPYLPENKSYQARIRFGISTNTDDLEGEIVRVQPTAGLTLEKIKDILPQFQGFISQIPPAYSAIQQGGKRLYELARKGGEVSVPERTVRVHKIEVLAWHPGKSPELAVAIDCGPGTYIRAIARDLGNTLNVGGTLATLARTESGGMCLSESLTFEELEIQLQRGTFSLIPPETALRHLPSFNLTVSEARRWCQGQKLELLEPQVPISPCRVYQEEAFFLGIGQLVHSPPNFILSPKVVLEGI